MLHDKAILVRLERSSWSPYKFDRKATQDVENLNHVQKAGRFNKHLFKGNLAFKKIQGALSNVYTYHQSKTLPWFYDGVNMLPSSAAFEYIEKQNKLIGELHTTVRQFDLDAAKLEDQQRLGSLYDDNDYPQSHSDFVSRFNATYNFIPVPNCTDFRVDIPESEKEKLVEQLGNVESNIGNEILKRISNILDPVITQCSKQEKTRWHKSLKTNILEAVPILRSFNLVDDSKINEVISNLQTFAETMDIDALKDNEDIRNETLAKAKSITDTSGGIVDDVVTDVVTSDMDAQAELDAILETI